MGYHIYIYELKRSKIKLKTLKICYD